MTLKQIAAVLAFAALSACSTPSSEPQAAEEPAFVETGLASWYGASHEGKKTASGEIYRAAALSAAHRTLAFGTVVRVTARASGKTVKVRVNDRGPVARGRIVDLSEAAAGALGVIESGVIEVRLETFKSDQRQPGISQ